MGQKCYIIYVGSLHELERWRYPDLPGPTLTPSCDSWCLMDDDYQGGQGFGQERVAGLRHLDDRLTSSLSARTFGYASSVTSDRGLRRVCSLTVGDSPRTSIRRSEERLHGNSAIRAAHLDP